MTKIALIGYGEAGSTFAQAGEWQSVPVWDVASDRLAIATQQGQRATESAPSCLGTADCVLSLVTADQAPIVAADYARHLPKGAIWCDMNSVSPVTKREAAKAIEAAGGHYVDVAILAPVNPAKLSVPLLIAGEKAEDAAQILAERGFTKTRIVSDVVGKAAAIKMIRSVMVKGMEALTYECAAAAEQAGVLDEVMSSLDASEKDWGWLQKTEYNRERMETHGARRAAEMEEVGKTLRDLGVEPVMSEGTVKLQREAARKTRERDQAA